MIEVSLLPHLNLQGGVLEMFLQASFSRCVLQAVSRLELAAFYACSPNILRSHMMRARSSGVAVSAGSTKRAIATSQLASSSRNEASDGHRKDAFLCVDAYIFRVVHNYIRL